MKGMFLMQHLLVILLMILGVFIVAIPAYQIGFRRGEDARDELIAQIIKYNPDRMIQFVERMKNLAPNTEVHLKFEKEKERK